MSCTTPNSSSSFPSPSPISPSFTFPHPITPVAYQQLLSQHRGLSAFGHTPPLIQPSPSFINRQHPIGTATAHSTSSSSNPSIEANQVSQFIREQQPSEHTKNCFYILSWRFFFSVDQLKTNAAFPCAMMFILQNPKCCFHLLYQFHVNIKTA